MEAVVRISGKQYRVAAGERVTVDRLATKVGDKVTFDQVLLLTDGPRATVGVPVVDGAAVTATVLAATRGPKLVVYKYKAKKRYRRTRGARAEQSILQIVAVTGPADGRARATGTPVAEPAKPPVADKPAKTETATPAAPVAEPELAARADTEKPAAAAAESEKPAQAKADKLAGVAAAKQAPAEKAKPAAVKPAKTAAVKPAKAEAEKPARTKAAKPAAPKKPAAKPKGKE
jgi:large subunit ribosomal protein L21